MTALATLLADAQQPISFVVEIVERDPDTDTETTRRYETPNREYGEGFGRYLADPGGRNDKLEVDELAAVGLPASIAGQEVLPVKLQNDPTAPGGDGPLDFLRDRSLSGRAITVYAGAPDEPFANYEAVTSGVMEREPIFNGNVVELRIKSPLARLDVDLDVGTYVGEPGALRILTTTGQAASADNAAHHLASFTLAGRFRHPAVGANSPVLTRRQTVGTNSNWNVFLMGSGFGASAGFLRLQASVGGVAAALAFNSTARYDDDEFHVWVIARSSAHAYIMVDGEVVAEITSPGSPDQPTAGVIQGITFNGPGEILDHRIFNHYIAPDEMRAAMAVRAEGTEEGLVGLWRGNDNVGNTLTDYSSTAAHATISGVENTAFEWVSSDLGTAELAGRSMPVIVGSVFNAPGDLVDPVRERWRVNDRPVVDAWLAKTVRDEGEELTTVTDYDWTDGQPVLELVAEAGEPLTVSVDEGAAGLPDHVLGVSAFSAASPPTASLLVDRGPLTGSTLDLDPLLSIYPHSLGLALRRQRVSEALRTVLGGCLGHAYSRADGTVVLDSLVAPLAPGPRDGACLSIVSAPDTQTGDHLGRVVWDSPAGTLAGQSFTMVCWVKSPAGSPSDVSVLTSALNLIDLRVESITFNAPAIQWQYQPESGISHLGLRWFTSGGTVGGSVRVPYSAFSAEWQFLAVVHDDPSDTTSFYAAAAGEPLALLGSTTGFGLAATPGVNGVGVGGGAASGYFRGSVAEPQLWDGTLTLSELQDLMDTPPVGNEADLAFYAPLEGASTAALTDTVSSEVGALVGQVREVPDLVLDLNIDPLTYAARRLRPAKSIRVEYQPNDAVLDPANIAATVTAEQALALQNEGKFEAWKSAEIEDDYEDAQEIELHSRWYSAQGARATLRLARHRYAPERELAELRALGRRGLLLEIGDEVRIYGPRWGLDAGAVFRVVAVNARLRDLTADLGLWR